MNPLSQHLPAGSAIMIVPTYNEAANISLLVPAVFSAVDGIHLLVVDDNSPDGTADICERLTNTYPNLQVLKRKGEPGLGRAYLAGIEFALRNRFDVIGTMDADLSHNPSYLPAMFSLIEDSDVVIGSRYIRDGGTINWPVRRIVLSWLANKFAGKLLGVPAHDLTSGFRLYRRQALQWIEPGALKSNGYSFLVELLCGAYGRGARIAESPIVFYDRTNGVSKLHKREIYRGAINLLRLRFRIAAARLKIRRRSPDDGPVPVMPADLSLVHGGISHQNPSDQHFRQSNDLDGESSRLSAPDRAVTG